MKPYPSQEYLRSILDYDPDTGVFRWKCRSDTPKQWNTRYAGTVAGQVNSHGYRIIQIGKRPYRACRLAWVYIHGEIPSNKEIDHKNCVRDDDRIKNLRPCTHSQNKANAHLRRGNRSGLKGVSFSKSNQKWQAQITIHGEHKHLGFYDDPTAAHAVYCGEAKRIFADFARAS